jgi:hypothetical protein
MPWKQPLKPGNPHFAFLLQEIRSGALFFFSARSRIFCVKRKVTFGRKYGFILIFYETMYKYLLHLGKGRKRAAPFPENLKFKENSRKM